MEKLTSEQLGRLTVEDFKKTSKIPLSLILDNVRSLNNIGSIFRSADAFSDRENIPLWDYGLSSS